MQFKLRLLLVKQKIMYCLPRCVGTAFCASAARKTEGNSQIKEKAENLGIRANLRINLYKNNKCGEVWSLL